jgi:hypothetical protein
MSLIHVDENLVNTNQAHEKGKKIYQKNDFMRSLSNLMEHPEFQEVYKKHFNTWDDIAVWVMFIKIYGKLSEKFPNLTGYQKIVMVQKLIGNAKTRKIICSEMIKFKGTNTVVSDIKLIE